MATRKATEISSHVDFIAADASRRASINHVRDTELSEAEAAATRAHTAHAKAWKVAEAEQTAARLERNAHVVGETLALFATALDAFDMSHELGRAEVFSKHFRNREEETQRALGRPITRELCASACNAFIRKHPQSLPRFACELNWVRLLDDGLAAAGDRAAVALRNPHDILSQQKALLELESTVARIATAPGFPEVHPDEAAELWAIRCEVLPSDLEQARLLAHAAAMKAKQVAAHVEETALRIACAQGDKAARAKIDSRGAGFLEAMLKAGESILRQAGFEGHEARPAP